AKRIKASGVRVVGDLSSLYSTNPAYEYHEETVEDVPLDLAAESLTGLMSASLGRGSHFASPKRDTGGMQNSANVAVSEFSPSQTDLPAQHAASTHTTRDLITALRIRLTHK